MPEDKQISEQVNDETNKEEVKVEEVAEEPTPEAELDAGFAEATGAKKEDGKTKDEATAEEKAKKDVGEETGKEVEKKDGKEDDKKKGKEDGKEPENAELLASKKLAEELKPAEGEETAEQTVARLKKEADAETGSEAEKDKGKGPEVEQALAKQKAEYETEFAKREAKIAELSKGTEDKEPTLQDLIDASDGDDEEKGVLKKFLEDYPENAKVLSVMLKANKGKATPETDVSKRLAELEEDRAERQAEQDQEAEQDEFWNKVRNGFKDESGKEIKGHTDAYEIASSDKFADWCKKEGLDAVAASKNPEHGIGLITAYKKATAKSSKEIADAKNKEARDKHDAVHSDTVRTTGEIPATDAAKSKEDLTGGFADGVAELKKMGL